VLFKFLIQCFEFLFFSYILASRFIVLACTIVLKKCFAVTLTPC